MDIKIPVTRAITITPPEAMAIAAEFRSAAQQIRVLSGELGSLGMTLETNWDGTAKQLFFEKYVKVPPRTRVLADWLETKAKYIENLKVTIWETHWETIGGK